MVLVDAKGEAEIDENVEDFKGNPVDKSRTGGWLAAGLILGTELSERICVMGIAMNLVTYLVGDLHLSSSKSANTVTNFMGTLNLLGLLGGFVADARLGRYLTVAISASITMPPFRIGPACNSAHDQFISEFSCQRQLRSSFEEESPGGRRKPQEERQRRFN